MEYKQILVVEDEPDIRELIVHVLQEEGYLVSHAPNGEVALALLTGTPVDLVITDVVMPLMTGTELLMAMRADDALRDIPTLVLSSLNEEDVRDQGDAVTCFMQKPFQLRPLLARIRDLLTLESAVPHL